MVIVVTGSFIEQEMINLCFVWDFQDKMKVIHTKVEEEFQVSLKSEEASAQFLETISRSHYSLDRNWRLMAKLINYAA